MARPTITKGKTGIGNFGVGVMPDGTSSTLRVLIKPDGFHFVPSDFEDLVLPTIKLSSPNGTTHTLGINNNGELLINNKQLKNNLQLTSSNGKKFNIEVDDEGNLTTKEVENATG